MLTLPWVIVLYPLTSKQNLVLLDPGKTVDFLYSLGICSSGQQFSDVFSAFASFYSTYWGGIFSRAFFLLIISKNIWNLLPFPWRGWGMSRLYTLLIIALWITSKQKGCEQRSDFFIWNNKKSFSFFNAMSHKSLCSI